MSYVGVDGMGKGEGSAHSALTNDDYIISYDDPVGYEKQCVLSKTHVR